MPSPLKKLAAANRDMPEDKKAKENGADDQESDVESVNVFKVEILDSKRERKEFPEKGMLNGWVSEHIVEKEEMKVNKNDLYDAYIDACMESNKPGVEIHILMKHINSECPKGFGINEKSPLYGKLKEFKNKPKTTKVQGETMGLKIKDILAQAFEDLGNPKKGLRPLALRNHIAMRYPALRVDIHPNLVMNAINRGVTYGKINLIKGVGKAGLYRMPLTAEQEEAEKKEEEEEEKKRSEERLKKKKEAAGLDPNADDAEKKDGEANKEVKSEANEDDKPKENDTKEGEGKTKKKRKKSAAARKVKKRKTRRRIVHSDPQTVAEAFQMAMTYMSDPKIASAKKIKEYIRDYYPDIDVDKRVPTALQRGLDKGYWVQFSGSNVSNGSFELTVEEFDPSRDNDLEDLIINAIVANHEPKQCSFKLLKEYITEYHPQFKIDDNPGRMRRALENALKHESIIQISGIGCTGTFQLGDPFTPSPAALAGQDTPSDYESDSEEEMFHDDGVDYSGYEKPVAYVPHRNPRNRGREIKTVARFDASSEPSRPRAVVRSGKGAKKSSRGGSKVTYIDTSDEESSEEEEEPPKRKRKQKKGKTIKKEAPRKSASKRKAKQESESEESEEEEAPKSKKSKASPKKKAKKPVKKEKKVIYKEDSEDNDSDDEPSHHSKKKAATVKRQAHGRQSSRGGGRGATANVSYYEDNGSESDSDFEVKKRKSSPKKSPIKTKAARKEIPEKTQKKAEKSKKKKAGKRR
ncbi:unnamed protein product [Owenia fusiformis]|uniref:H15 domain-containing protein n=1 Tax=Owenia fusiformis TaxID=6347 RepID=A0A8S4N304_OWEFU|nr:unnamed protein product [Owenia fusiformis]